MGIKDYGNYNRTYSSDSYRNNNEDNYGESSETRNYNDSYNDLESGIKSELEKRIDKEELTGFGRFKTNTPSCKSHSQRNTFSCSFFVILFIVLVFGTAFVFLPQIHEALRKRNSTKTIPSFVRQKIEESKKSTKSPAQLEAEVYGLQEQEYIALKGLGSNEISQKLKEGSFKRAEKRFLAVKAIETDDSECLSKVIKSGYSIDTQDDNNASLLYIAVRNKKEKCSKLLIDSGANIKLETKDGDTILHAAAYNGNLEIVKLAIMAGIPVDKPGAGKKTPLYRAAQNNQGYMCRMLVLAGAQRLPRYSMVTDDLDLKHFFQTGRGYWSPAVSTSTSKFKGNQPEGIEEAEKQKWSKVSRCVSEGRLSDLLKEVPNPEDFKAMSLYELPPVCIAAKSGQLEVLKYLNSIGCDMLEIDKATGKSALHFAAQSGKEEVVGYLLEKTFVAVDLQDNFNNTALHYSVLNPLPFITSRLLKAGANPNLQNLKLQTPLHMAVEKSNVLGVKILLDSEANINQRDYAGNTAFHYVAMKANMKEMLDVFYLHEDVLDTTIKNNEGKTAKECQRWDYFKHYDERYR